MWDRYYSGDFAGTWDLLAPEAQKLINQAGYDKLLSACDAPTPSGVTVTDPRWRPDGTVVVTVKTEIPVHVAVTRTLNYSAGRWGELPTAEAKTFFANFKKYGAAKAAELARCNS
jgi:hypothetical protein